MKIVATIVLAVATGFAFLGSTCAPARAQEPVAVVEQFQADLIHVMQNAHMMSVRERYDRLMPAAEAAFHFPIMAGMAAGGYWKTATQAQREALVRAFMRKNISTVATLFDGYSGERFDTVGDREAPQNSRVVETRLNSKDGSFVKLAYRLVNVGSHWRIIDVIVDDGISEVSVRKSEYHDTLRTSGIDGLIRTLDAKADELLAE